MLQRGVDIILLDEINLDEILELVVFEVAFEDVDFDVLAELFDSLETLDLADGITPVDEVTLEKEGVLERELVVDETFKEEVVREEEDVLM